MRQTAEQGHWNVRVWALAGPIMISNLSTPLLGAVDTAVVGWGFGFLRMGTTGFTAQAYGAGEPDELRAALARPLILALILGALLIALQIPIGWLAFRLFEASDQVEALAESCRPRSRTTPCSAGCSAPAARAPS
jgi:MATE family multidrug resistance protein